MKKILSGLALWVCLLPVFSCSSPPAGTGQGKGQSLNAGLIGYGGTSAAITAAVQAVRMGSYSLDSHNIQRYVKPDGYVQNEGDIGVSVKTPYQIGFGALVPKKGEAQNLLVPVCLSSSHIAYGSIRMEPVFMILGQSAATAAVMALERGLAVQDLDYNQLRARLEQDKQVLT